MEIAISATLDVDAAFTAIVSATIRGMRSLLDIDISYASFVHALQQSARSLADIDKSLFTGEVNKLEALESIFDIDTSNSEVYLNQSITVRSLFEVDASTVIGNVNKVTNVYPDWNIEESSALITFNSSKSVSGVLNSDRASGRLSYLYLKNPPLPPELDGYIRVRSAKSLPLNKSQLIAGSTYQLEATIDGQRIDGINFVFTIKSNQIILLQKATIETPQEYLVTRTGLGDIMISNSTPVKSGSLGAAEEITATIIIKPDEFKVTRNTVFSYDFWAYDALGTNTLLEAGTFNVGKT
jgi:hypothetical protein